MKSYISCEGRFWIPNWDEGEKGGGKQRFELGVCVRVLLYGGVGLGHNLSFWTNFWLKISTNVYDCVKKLHIKFQSI